MKKVFKPMRVLVSMLVLNSPFCLTACSNDDENTPQLPDEVTTGTMFGNYTGKMPISSLFPTEKENNEEAPVGVDISATVNNDTVYFEKSPIKDIVLSIVKDETLTDKIVEAVGDVNYKVGYKPTLTAAKDSTKFVLNPESLKLSVAIPSETENENPEALLIEVKVEPGKEAGYSVESANMKFNLAATKALLGEGENQQELSDFALTTFNFDMNQHKIVHSRF